MRKKLALGGLAVALASTALTPAALAQLSTGAPQVSTPAPEIRLCTGSAKGKYNEVGAYIRQQIGNKFKLAVVNSETTPATNGSIDNLEALADGTCQAAIVQSNAYISYAAKHPESKLDTQRVDVLYPEYTHVVCNNARKISSITDLTAEDTVLVDRPGSGTQTVWADLVKVHKKLAEVKTNPVGGISAIGQVKDGSNATCLMFVAGLKSQTMLDVNQNAIGPDGKSVLHLVKVPSDATSLKDAKGKPYFTAREIPGSTYSNLQSGFFSSAVPTVAPDAIVVVSSKFVEQNPRAYEAFIEAELKAQPTIRQAVSAR